MNHESNSLNPIITGEDDFIVFRGGEITGKGMLPYYSSTGIINTLREAGAEIIPTVLARAVPNGVVSGAFYQKIKNEMLDMAKEAKAKGPVDGICLALHGSMKVEDGSGGSFCAEGDLCSALREILPDIPFTAALDMHATITPELLKAVDGFAGYKTAPHIDCIETGAQAASMLLESLETGKKLYTASVSLPIMIAGEKSETDAEPMKTIMDACREKEKEAPIKAASVLLGFPWADAEQNAVTVLVSAIDAPASAGATASADTKASADSAAAGLARLFWRHRKDFRFSVEFYNSRESMAQAYKAVLEKNERPVFVSDSGDNPTAGAAGDATDLFEAILETIDTADKLPTPLLFSGFYDAPASAACIKAGEGAEIDITLGGNWDKTDGKKIPLRVKVKKISGNFGPYKSNLVLLSWRNLLITVTSKHIGFSEEELLPALGVNPADYCLVALKIGYLEPCFKSIAARAIMATSRGCSNEVLESIGYKKVRRPIFPLDYDTAWSI
jgi:microcystin degradation protein MlrC